MCKDIIYVIICHRDGIMIVIMACIPVCLYRKNRDEVALLSAREASARYPEVVVAFYEDKLTWHSGDEDQ